MAGKPALPDGPALIVVGGPTDGEVFPLEKDRSMIVGSGRLANLRLGPSAISSAHVKIHWDDTGLFITDNDSFTGTFLNGDPVETGPLMDGDLVAFGPPEKAKTWPQLRAHVPAGSVIVTAAPLSPSESALATARLVPATRKGRAVQAAGSWAAKAQDVVKGLLGRFKPGAAAPAAPARPAPGPAVARVPMRGRPMPVPARRRGPSVDPRIVGAIAAGVAVVAGLWWLVTFLFTATPTLTGVEPAAGEVGQAVTLNGDHFATESGASVVRFGDTPATVVSATPTKITVTVPAVPQAGTELPVSVQVGRRRSRPVTFRVDKTLKVIALVPDVAWPGDEVVARGSGLDAAGTYVIVEGRPAAIVEAKANELRFRVPDVATQPVRAIPVLVRTGQGTAKPVDLTIGRLPILLKVDPPRADVGERVKIKGRGFAVLPGGNLVRVGEVAAFVLAATPNELQIAAPDAAMLGPAPITVETGGRASSGQVSLLIGAGSSQAFRLRFFPAPAEGGDRAYVSTAFGPMLRLSSKDDAPSVGERAFKAAMLLNAVAERLRNGRPTEIEARTNPPAITLAGTSDVLLRITAEDANGYAEVPGLERPAAAPSPSALAAHWAALVSDYLAIFVQSQRPVRLFEMSAHARALLDLQTDVGFRPGAPVAAVRVAQVSPATVTKLRELALIVAPAVAGAGSAAVEGRWEGDLVEADGTAKAVVVELRTREGRLTGSLSTGRRRVSMAIPLQELVVQQGTLRFKIRTGSQVRVFIGKVAGNTIEGELKAGSAEGASAGRLTLRFAPVSG